MGRSRGTLRSYTRGVAATRVAARRAQRWIAAIAAGLLSCAAAAQDDGYTLAAVAKIGDRGPAGLTYAHTFEPEGINAQRDVAFESDLLDGQGGWAGEALFLKRRGVTSLVAASGMPAPGTSMKFGTGGIASPASLNESGDIAFAFTLGLPAAPALAELEFGVWRYSASTHALTKIMVPGDPAPGHTTFRGSDWHASINDRGDIAAVGVVDTRYGHCRDAKAPCAGIGRGVYRFDRANGATKVVAPGDAAPAGGFFDDAWDPNINNAGDIVFGAHVAGETACQPDGGAHPDMIGCFESLYVYRAGRGEVVSIAHRGDSARGALPFLFAWNGRINDAGDISFIATLTYDVATGTTNGVFLHTRDGGLRKVAAPGDMLPGGRMVNASGNQGAHAITPEGDVVFAAQLAATTNPIGGQDTGVYRYHDGRLQTVVRTGSVIPGLGKVAQVNSLDYVGASYPWPLVHVNRQGQVLTQVILENGDQYVVVATPD